MLSHRNPAEHRSLVRYPALDQGEIRSPAADVDHQYEPNTFQPLGKIFSMTRGEVVERCLWFLQQTKSFQPGLLGRFYGKRSCDFVEGCRHGDHHVLRAQGISGMCLVPGPVQVTEQPRGGMYRRKLGNSRQPTPGKNWRLTIHRGMAEPAFGRDY